MLLFLFLYLICILQNFPTLTTFFEAEIVGPQFSFLTDKWGSSKRIDYLHWSRFNGFDKVKDKWDEPDFKYDFKNNGYIFMRWKGMCLSL